MADAGEPNISAIRVAGIGGLAMVVVAAATVYALPAARWLVLGGLTAGILIAGALILLRRRAARHAPDSILHL